MNNDFLPFALDPSRNAGDWNNNTAESLAASQVVTRQDGYSLYTDYYAVASEGSDLQTNGDETDAQNYVTVPQHYHPRKDSQFFDSSTSKNNNWDRGAVEEHAAIKLYTNSSNSRDVLAMLISGNVRGEHYVPSSSLLQDCQIASQEAELASDEIRQNNIPSALKNLYSSSLHYRKAAQSIAQKDIGLATSFLLLSQSHWKRAEAIRLASRLPRNRQQSCNKDIPNDSSNNEAPPLHIATPSLPDKATQSSLRAVVIRDALHANNATLEEDISASVFLGKNKTSTTDVILKSAKEETSTMVPTNPVDDMLQLEKELHTMNMALSMHASVANLAATKTTSSPMNLSASLMMRSGATGGLESSWWGQSSYLHSPRPHISSNNVVDLTSSISSWATTTTACSTIRPSSQQQGVQTRNSHATSTDLSQQLPPPSTSTSNPRATNNNNNAKQLLRLLDSLKVLGDENAALLQQVEDAKKARLEAQAAREEMKRFQLDYHKRFHSLKVALEKLHQQQQQQKQSTESNPVLSSEILKREDRKKNSKQQQRILESQVQSLKTQVETLQEESKKKDAVLKKYENFYKEVKARSAQRAAQRGATTADSSPSSTK